MEKRYRTLEYDRYLNQGKNSQKCLESSWPITLLMGIFTVQLQLINKILEIWGDSCPLLNQKSNLVYKDPKVDIILRLSRKIVNMIRVLILILQEDRDK